MKIVYLFLFLVILFRSVEGQYIVNGFIIDSVSKGPIELANVVLLKDKDSSLVKGAVTQSNGFFILNNVEPGIYFLNISCIGYKGKKIENLLIPGGLSDNLLDTVYLAPGAVTMKEVRITAEKSSVVYLEDKIILNVGKDVLSFGGSAVEVIEYAPLIKVDIDDNISMIGKSSVLICLDGIPLKDMGLDYKDFLKTTPATDIDRVEIITEPPIEYGIMENGGVINIITKKLDSGRYSGIINGSGTSNKTFTANAGLSYRKKTFSIRGSAFGMYGSSSFDMVTQRLTNFDGSSFILSQDHSGTQNNLNSNFGIYLNYMPDAENILNQTLFYRLLDKDIKGSYHNIYSLPSEVIPLEFRSETDKNTNTGFFTYALSYTKLFKQKGQKLISSFSYSNNLMKYNSDLFGETENLDFFNQKNTSSNKNNTLLFRATYNHPVSTMGSIMFGYKISLKKLNLMNNYYDVFNKGITSAIHQKYDQSDQELFFSFQDQLWGIRYGISPLIAKNNLTDKDVITNESFSYEFLEIYPAAGISTSLAKNHRLSLGWHSGSNHPMNKQLNPHIDYSDSSNIIQGNPNLKPGRYSFYSFGYSYNNFFGSISTGISYSDKKDLIESYSYLLNSKTTYTTYRNIGKANGYNWYLSLSGDLFEWWSAGFSVEASKTEYKNEYNNNNAALWSGMIDSKFKFSLLSFQFRFSYLPQRLSAQSKSDDYFKFDLGVKSNIYKKRLYLAFKAEDLLNTLRNSSTTYGTGFISNKSTSETTRILSLNLTYFFDDSEMPDEELQETEEDDF